MSPTTQQPAEPAFTEEMRTEEMQAETQPVHWATRGMLLWQHRRLLTRVGVISLALGLGLAFIIPKRYTAVTTIMPPSQQGAGALMLAALASHGGGGLGTLGSLAGGLLGGSTSTALYINLLESGTVRGSLIERFNLKQVYHTRYNENAGKHLARVTTIADDKKSGMISIRVQDTDPVRARDMAQAYLDALNQLLNQTSTSSAREERIFIEHRLHSAEKDLEQAQVDLSDFSSKNTAIDMREQTRALVDSGAKIQGELLVEQASLQSLRQIYGDQNVRVKETEARIGALQHDLDKMTGTSAAPPTSDAGGEESDKGALYPPLRQLPRLAVPYADLYRRVRVQEAVYELLTQQYEMARIEEAKDTPVIKVIDSPQIPERKSFPPRLTLAVVLMLLSLGATVGAILFRESWATVDPNDPRKQLVGEIYSELRQWIPRWISRAPADRQGAV